MLHVPALAGNAQVEELQRALRSLAQAAGWPAVDPGAITGEVDIQLMTSFVNAAGGALDLPGYISTALSVVTLAGWPDEAYPLFVNFVYQYGGELTFAINKLTQRYLGQVPPEPEETTQPADRPAVNVKQKIMSFTTERYVSPGSLTPVVKPIREYPIGSITAQKKDGSWRIAVPKSALSGGWAGLGQNALQIFEASKAGDYVEVEGSTTKPVGPLVVDEPTLKKAITPWYKTWKLWVPVGGVVVAAGTYYIARR